MKQILCSQSRIKMIVHEQKILQQLESEFIIAYEDSFIEGNYFFLLTQYCEVNHQMKISTQNK